MEKTYDLRLNSDGTLTVRVGRQVESIGLVGKSPLEVEDMVRWALISKDIPVSEKTLAKQLHDLMWRHLGT
jgi:hypothetical protein